MEKEIYYHIALATNPLITFRRYQTILRRCGELAPFFDLSVQEQVEMLGVTQDSAKMPFEDMLRRADLAVNVIQAKGIYVDCYNFGSYPPMLRQIPLPPFALFRRGEANYSVPLIAVVGTRQASRDAVDINRHFTSEFVRHGFGIVSGLALGHDAVAAQAALSEYGYTVAVLGTAIDAPSPKANRYLYDQICEHGTVYSEYPPGTESAPWRFPIRNRLISGLGHAVFVVQAPENSGTLITVAHAEEQNRDVYVIPGSVNNAAYRGTNMLIQKGARVILSPEELMRDLTHLMTAHPKVPRPTVTRELSKEEQGVLDLLEQEMHVDALAARLKLNTLQVNQMLLGLEMEALVQQMPGRFYKRCV